MENISLDCSRCKKLIEWLFERMNGQSWWFHFRCPHKWDNIIQLPDDEELESFISTYDTTKYVKKVSQRYIFYSIFPSFL